jgi:sulfonate transport system substrate-binding protein
LAGRLDVLFLGDQPALRLVSRQASWRIVSQLVKYRSAFVVPPLSTINTLEDLKDKRIGTAFGSTTHRDAARILLQNGIDPLTQVRFVNIDQAEHGAVIAAGANNGKWGEIDAIATYDPTIAVVVSGSLARLVSQWASLGVVLASANMLSVRREQLEKLLRSLREAYPTYALAPDKYDELYIQDANLKLSKELLRQQTLIDPNLSVRDASAVRQSFSPEDIVVMKANVNVAVALKLLPGSFQFDGVIDDAIVKRLEAGG